MSHDLSRRARSRLLRLAVRASAALVCLLLALTIGFVLARGLPHVTWPLLSGQTSYLKGTVGILPNLLNMLYLLLVALALAVPLGVGAAVYLTEYARSRRLARAVGFAVRTLTGIPSVLFGLIGMLFFLQGMGLRAGILAGGLTMAMMILPTVVENARESLLSVPQAWREGALALGSGKARMIATVVLPGAAEGIVTGCILAAGRVVGESAALLFTAGFGLALTGFVKALTTSSATLTVALYVYASERGDMDTAFAIAAVLMLLTLLLNGAASLASRRLGRQDRPKGGPLHAKRL